MCINHSLCVKEKPIEKMYVSLNWIDWPLRLVQAARKNVNADLSSENILFFFFVLFHSRSVSFLSSFLDEHIGKKKKKNRRMRRKIWKKRKKQTKSALTCHYSTMTNKMDNKQKKLLKKWPRRKLLGKIDRIFSIEHNDRNEKKNYDIQLLNTNRSSYLS